MKSNKFKLWDILRRQGRSTKWLADEIGMSRWHVYHIRLGQREATEEFQKRCEKLLSIDREILFSLSQRSVA